MMPLHFMRLVEELHTENTTKQRLRCYQPTIAVSPARLNYPRHSIVHKPVVCNSPVHHGTIFFERAINLLIAHAGGQTQVTSMGGLYDAATLHALYFH